MEIKLKKKQNKTNNLQSSICKIQINLPHKNYTNERKEVREIDVWLSRDDGREAAAVKVTSLHKTSSTQKIACKNKTQWKNKSSENCKTVIAENSVIEKE